METKARLELYDKLFKFIIPLVMAIGTWYIKEQATQIGALTASLNSALVQQRELFIKLEAEEKHLTRSDANVNALFGKVNQIELRIERLDERLKKSQKND